MRIAKTNRWGFKIPYKGFIGMRKGAALLNKKMARGVSIALFRPLSSFSFLLLASLFLPCALLLINSKYRSRHAVV